MNKYLRHRINLYSTFLNNVYEFKNIIIPIKTDTLSGIELLYNQKIQIDLFYIDANHSYDSVKKEILLIRKRYPSALISGDDYDFHYRGIRGVQKAVDELSTKYKDIQLVVKGPCWFFQPINKS